MITLTEIREQLTDIEYEPPQGTLETTVAQIEAEVLGVDRVGRSDSFCDFGGTSLQAIRICTRIERETGRQAEPGWLFDTGILSEFAERLRSGEAAPGRTEPRESGDGPARRAGRPQHAEVSNAVSARSGAYDRATQAGDSTTAAVSVPVLALKAADSPRLNGENRAHIARLVETETQLPPILVDKRTMRVIDGMHRVMAASLQGREAIDVIFVDGSEADIFLRAVQENIAHGLPLSRADRRAAAERIIASHPHMSDRAISHSVGLGNKMVADIRRRSSEGLSQLNARVGRDGRVRPVDSGEGRRRAAELLAQQPDASMRAVARAVGISPATVNDVRKRLERGDSPVPGKYPANDMATSGAEAKTDSDEAPVPDRLRRLPGSRSTAPSSPALTVEKLLRDPSLRGSDWGRGVLRLLHATSAAVEQLPDTAMGLPPHCVSTVAHLARQYARMWQDFARELDGRARIINPSEAVR